MRAILFNLPLLHAAVAIEEDSLNYDAVMRAYKFEKLLKIKIHT